MRNRATPILIFVVCFLCFSVRAQAQQSSGSRTGLINRVRTDETLVFQCFRAAYDTAPRLICRS
jgi:hypothetical protein